MNEEGKLAAALESLAEAVKAQTRVLKVLVDGMKPSTEAAILGVSVRTVSRRRQERRLTQMLT